jgi:hypothetical protein
MSTQKKRKKKKAKKQNAAKVILMTGEEREGEEDLDEDDEEEESGIYLDKEDVRLIYNALKNYKPAGDEDVLYDTLLEQFEEMLVVDFGVRLPGFECMDEEEN